MNAVLAATIAQDFGPSIFFGGLILAMISFIVGIVLACTKRPKKWVEALVVGIGLPILFVGIAFAGCTAALNG